MNEMKASLGTISQFIPDLCLNKIAVMISGDPAIGKSSVVHNFAKKNKLKLIDERLLQCDPTDLKGLPATSEDKAMYKPFDTFPIEGDKIPDGYNGWLIFLDEFNSASPAVQAAAYKLVLDRKVGNHKLHDKCYIVACGNLETSNAYVVPMNTALISRFAQFQAEFNLDEWKDWASANDIDTRILSFIGFKPQHAYTFTPDATSSYACPRTWEMVSKLIKDKTELSSMLVLLSGLVGQGVATEFLAYNKLYAEIPSIESLLENPNQALPKNLGMQWAIMGMLCHHINKDNAKTLYKVIEQLPPELQMCLVKDLLKRNTTIITVTLLKEFQQVVNDLMS